MTNSIFEGRGVESYDSIRTRLADAICPECGYVSNHTQYPRCSYRDAYEATGNPFSWRDQYHTDTPSPMLGDVTAIRYNYTHTN